MENIYTQFLLEGNPVSLVRYGNGHINDTYLLLTDEPHAYILQRINSRVFSDVPKLMDNIIAVTDHLRRQDDNPRHVLTLVPTKAGDRYLTLETGEYWRLYEFVTDSICLDKPENAHDLMQSGVVLHGGQTDRRSLRIAPTLLTDVAWDSPVMSEEIFGPLLPILTVDSLDEAIRRIRQRPKPLALYLFTRDREAQRRVLEQVSFGGGCINDTVMHLATPYMPFGGVGESGMGRYHGKDGFDTFSHRKSVLCRGARPDVPLRYAPYGEKRLKTVRRLL